MIQLSPERWRILNYLRRHGLHAVRPRLTHVRRSQQVTDADLLDLDEMYLIRATLGHREMAVAAVIRKLSKYARLYLTRSGLMVMSGDPFNQIRYTLGQHGTPITLKRLFEGNTLTYDEIRAANRTGQINLTVAEGFPHDVNWLVHLHQLPAGRIRVALTSKGREYLPL